MTAFGPRFVGLTGRPPRSQAVEKEYRVYAAKQPLAGGNYGMDHSSVIYLMGPNGKLVSFYDEASLAGRSGEGSEARQQFPRTSSLRREVSARATSRRTAVIDMLDVRKAGDDNGS